MRLGGGHAGREVAQRPLQLLLGSLEFARELGIQVTTAVDVADQVGLGLGGAGGGGLCFLRGGAERGEFRASRLKRAALAFELGNGLGVSLDAVAIQLGQCRHRARGLSRPRRSGVDSSSRRYRAWPSL